MILTEAEVEAVVVVAKVAVAWAVWAWEEWVEDKTVAPVSRMHGRTCLYGAKLCS